jgi:hypothetical protein
MTMEKKGLEASCIEGIIIADEAPGAERSFEHSKRAARFRRMIEQRLQRVPHHVRSAISSSPDAKPSPASKHGTGCAHDQAFLPPWASAVAAPPAASSADASGRRSAIRLGDPGGSKRVVNRKPVP